MTNQGSRPVVAVAGAGRMGLGIALAFAYGGHRVVVVDLKNRSAADFQVLTAGFLGQIRDHLAFLVKMDALTPDLSEQVISRVSVVPYASAEGAAQMAATDIVFEAVPEVLEVKAAAFADICRAVRADALLASTTSTFNADTLAGLVSHPERFANAHWLNPAHLIPLVELSPCSATSPENLAKLRSLLQDIGKVPVVCKSSPGYIVPRIQALAMNEAARLVEEGIASAEDVDTAIRTGFGLRFAVLGLLEFIDWGGGDILYYASKNLAENIDKNRFTAPQIVQQNMLEHRRGLRDGQGFYDYRDSDVGRYRDERLAAFIAILRHRNLMPTLR